jgi:hypothetical protein
MTCRKLVGRMNLLRICVFALVAVAAAAAPARAGHICELVDVGVLEVDADIGEWRDFRALSRGHGEPGASYEMRCGYDGKRLYVMVRVHDDRVYRTGKGGADSDDNLVLTLAAADGRAPWTMRFWPGTRGFKTRRDGGRGVKVDDTLLEDGWAMEASVPLSGIPGWGPSTPLVRGEVIYHDVDQPGGGGAATLRFRGSMHFSSAVPALRGFLVAARLGVPGLRVDALADIDGLPGSERVVSGGRFVGILTDAFGFIELPIKSDADVLAVNLVDLGGSGRLSILTHYRQHGGGGRREVVKVWTLGSGGQLESPLAFETGLVLGKRTLTNRWSLVPAGTRRAPEKGTKPRRLPGQDFVVEVADADNHGWDAATFAQVVPSPDVRPILTPFGERRAVVYFFEGEVAAEAPALPEK